MADIQKYIVDFDSAIRLKKYDENQTLRDKREVVLSKLRTKFAAWRKEGKEVPTFKEFNQGSYQMGTGVQPGKGDYDIDVGLRFECKKKDYPNPVDLKILVADALEGHTELGTTIRKSCVTVKYTVAGEQGFHVDLAVYAFDDPESQAKKLFLAKGKRNSDEKNRWWEESDPFGLMDWVEKRFKGDEEQSQYLRAVRCLKRWKSEKFATDGNCSPTGIGLTIAAGQWFQPKVTRDPLTKQTTSDDLAALKSFIDSLVTKFVAVGKRDDDTPLYRLKVSMPVVPFNDLFEKMSDVQMTDFRDRLLDLQTALKKAIGEADPVAACKLMKAEFGEEFPVPPKEETGQSRGRAITSSGVSA